MSMPDSLPPVPSGSFMRECWDIFCTCLRKENYARLQGRAGCMEYWVFTILATIITFLPLPLVFLPFLFVSLFAALLFLALVFYLAMPMLAVFVRRLHDVGWSGKWIALYYSIICFPFAAAVFHVTQFIIQGYDFLYLAESLMPWMIYSAPFINILGALLFVLTLLPGNSSANKYGDKL